MTTPNSADANAGTVRDTSETRTRRWLRLDLFVSFAALFFSGIAALGTWYQTNVVAEQLSATVWPYLEFATTTTHGTQIAFSIRNDGTGPAILRGVKAMVDGKPYRSWSEVLGALGYRAPSGKTPPVDQSSLDYGEVIRAGQSITYLSIKDAPLYRRVLLNPNAQSLRVCYCSILARCWIETSDNVDPASVANCDDFHRAAVSTGTVH